MEWIWLGVIISLLLIEFISLNLTAIWFVISGIVSYILFRCGQDYIIQVTVFLVLGLLLILLVRHRIKERVFKYRDKVINNMVSKHPFWGKIFPSELVTAKSESSNSKQKKKGLKK